MTSPKQAILTDEQIKQMVERFLQWKLPRGFNPDGGISFTPMMNEHTDFPSRREPVGTNLLSYSQAEEMVRFMIADLAAPQVLDEKRKAALDDLAKVDYHPRSVDDGHYDAGFHQEQAGGFLDKHIQTVYAALKAPAVQAVPRDAIRLLRLVDDALKDQSSAYAVVLRNWLQEAISLLTSEDGKGE